MLEVDPRVILDAIIKAKLRRHELYNQTLNEVEAELAAYEKLPWYIKLFKRVPDGSGVLFIRHPDNHDAEHRPLKYLCQHAISIGQATIPLPLKYSYLLPTVPPKHD